MKLSTGVVLAAAMVLTGCASGAERSETWLEIRLWDEQRRPVTGVVLAPRAPQDGDDPQMHYVTDENGCAAVAFSSDHLGFTARKQGFESVTLWPDDLQISRDGVVEICLPMRRISPDAVYVETFNLQYASAAGAAAAVAPYVGTSGHISPFPTRNALVVRCAYSNLVEVRAIIDKIDRSR